MAGPITIVFLVGSLTLSEQGIYYALSTIMSIQLFFELGLLNILISQAGHQSSASLAATSALEKQTAARRMGQLIATSQSWFLVASSLYCVCAILFGWKALSAKAPPSDWWLPLIALSVAAAATVAVSPRLAILEGAGYRSSVYRTRLFQMILGAVVVWVSLSSGLKVWALVASTSVQLLCSLLLTEVFHRDFFAKQAVARKQSPATASNQEITGSWLTEVLPLQWRIALTSLVYHAATQFFTVIILEFDGDEEAGRIGMTLAITGAIQGMALTWLQTKFSLVSAMHGAGNREAAGELWKRSAAISTGLIVLAMTVAIILVAALRLANRGWEDRFIQPWQISVLGFGCVANHLVALQSFYVLSRKGRPFMLPGLVGPISTGMAVLVGGYFFSTSGVVCGYALTTACITLPLHTLAYLRYRRQSVTA